MSLQTGKTAPSGVSELSLRVELGLVTEKQLAADKQPFKRTKTNHKSINVR